MQENSRCAVILASLLALVKCAMLGAGHQGLLAAETETNSANELSAATSDFTVSDWGPGENGLQMRVSAPREIEQGMPLNVAVELRAVPEKLDPRFKKLNLFCLPTYLELTLVDQPQQQPRTVTPYDANGGMRPPPDAGKATIALEGKDIDVNQTVFPLVKLYKELQPATYECQVRFRFPAAPTRYWHGTPEEWNAAGFWHGTLTSGTFPLRVLQETPKVATFLVPKRLRVGRKFVRLRSDDQSETPVSAAHFDKEDAEEFEAPVRNGHFIGTRIRGDGSETLKSGPLQPDDENAIKVWYRRKDGKQEASITIEIFETADRPEHMWGPRRDVLWAKTFDLSLAEVETRKD